jgi:hypothetical protein
MNRRLLNLLTALSLLLFVVVCVLWVRSYWREDTVLLRTMEPDPADLSFIDYVIRTVHGRVVYMHRNVSPGPQPDEVVSVPVARQALEKERGLHYFSVSTNRLPAARRESGWLGFQIARYPTPDSQLTLVAPLWALAGASAILPALFARRWQRGRKDRRVGLCPSCGYDLRATPGRCPECGKEPTLADVGRRTPRPQDAKAGGGE